MTADERREMLRRRPAAPATTPGRRALEIGGETAGRRAVRLLARLATLAAVMAVFVVAFFRFTASWQVAVLVVAAMGGYMLLIGRMVEGRADRID